jgi:hypothetical protein
MELQAPPSSEWLKQPKLKFWEVIALAAFMLGLIIIAVYGYAVGKKGLVFAVLGITAAASWLAGSLLGFLFGVPRFQSERVQTRDVVDPATYIPNTNLEQISDWLTKLIVGAALVQVREIGDAIGQISILISAQINAPGAASMAGGIVIFDTCAGFMWGYLWCSLRIFREMAASLKDKTIN